MNSETMDVVSSILDWAFFIFVAVVWAIACIATAMRPANDRAAMLRGLPPATDPIPVRMRQLRLRAESLARPPMLVIGPCIGVAFFLVGLAIIVDRAPFDVGVLLEITLVAVSVTVGWELLVGMLLFAQYCGAKKRILLDAQVEGSSIGREV